MVCCLKILYILVRNNTEIFLCREYGSSLFLLVKKTIRFYRFRGYVYFFLLEILEVGIYFLS